MSEEREPGLPTQKEVDRAVKHLSNLPRHENAAGKKLCGMCGWKAAGKGNWCCTNRSLGEPLPCPFVSVNLKSCPCFAKKFSITRTQQPKQQISPAVSPGVQFLYFGRPGLDEGAIWRQLRGLGPPNRHRGVVTVAYAIAEKSHLVEISFSFCSPEDRWCKATGRRLADQRLGDKYLTVPYLYSPKRTIHEVARAVMKHDWKTLFRIADYTQADLRPFQRSVPGWTRDLAKRLAIQNIPIPILYRMMADIAKLQDR